MKNDSTKLWVKAGKILADNKDASVPCPVCAKANLQVKDIKSKGDSSIVEREMKCPVCRAHNYLRLLRPDVDEGYPQSND